MLHSTVFLTFISHCLAAGAGALFRRLELFEFDDTHFESSVESPVSILFGAVGTDYFKKFHIALAEAAKEVYHFRLLCLYIVLSN